MPKHSAKHNTYTIPQKEALALMAGLQRLRECWATLQYEEQMVLGFRNKRRNASIPKYG
jgi:hypothetical protein